MRERLVEILAPYRGQRGVLIPILEKVQEELGYLPEEAISEVARFLHLSKNEVYGVASFYALFRFKQPGEHTIRVCQGTACHVRGGRQILDTVERELGVQSGDTTEDHRFSLERVACFGACALAPVMVVDKTVHGGMTTNKVRQILAKYSQKPSINEGQDGN
ncbi:MAG: NADH-quinone oxidoreductase subunit NuoE [Dehalococcoidales bacterium]|nr:NADH-quinone oxidoreductase subunit NuoE [Dehalococcoidales bacterium]